MSEGTSSRLELLRAEEVANTLGLSRSRAYAMMAAEVVPTVRIGRSVRVPAGALQDWIKANTRQAEDSSVADA